jgi:transcription elongation GreA/GreB family factor
MSRAFVNEQDGGGEEDLPDRPVSPHPNYVTPAGLAAIEAEVTRLQSELAGATVAADRAAIARLSRDLRYWYQRRSSAELVEPAADTDEVRFGMTVTLRRRDGGEQTWRIVGEDEADPGQGSISYVAPLARALIGKSVGDTVAVPGGKAKIISIQAQVAS